MPTNGDDTINFSGTLGQLTVAMTNPYSGRVIEIDDRYNVNNSTYDGLGGTDTLHIATSGGRGGALFVTDNVGMQVIRNIEIITTGNGNNIINLAHASIVLNAFTITGGNGDDIIWGNAGDDVINGGRGDDIIDGGPGDDVINGGRGDDDLTGGAGSDILDGGRGDDIIYYNDDADWGATDVTFNLGSPNYSHYATPVFLSGYNRSYDAFVGGQDVDTIQMTSGNDAIFLEDAITVNPLGANGDPRIVDVEIIRAGAGNDVVNMTSPNWTYGDVKLYGEDGDDFLWGNEGNDVIVGGAGRDHMDGGLGDDILVVGAGRDRIFTQDGDSDQIVYNVLESSSGSDVIWDFETGAGRDVLNLTDILTGYDPLTSVLSDFVYFTNVGPNTRVYVDGNGGGNNFNLLAVFMDGVPGTAQDLLNSGNLVLDQSVVV